jgi:flagellar L-ring protein precursor FlgH
MSKLAVIAIGLTLLAGCYSAGVERARPLAPNPKQFPHYQLQPKPGSIYSPTASQLYRDFTAHKVGDIVVVQIVENSSADKKAATNASRTSSLSAGMTNLLGFTNLIPKGKNFWQETQNSGTPDLSVLVKGSLTSSHQGEGETNKSDQITTSVAARVMAVLPNGLLYIKGSRQVKVNYETQVVTLSGLVNPQDISATNTVQLTQVSDARVLYSGRGPVTDKQRPGWLTRIIEWVWPF